MNRLDAAVVFCIALGMAATAAVATLVDLVNFRAPDFPAAERFVRIWNTQAGVDIRSELSYRDYQDLNDGLPALDALEGVVRSRLVWHLEGLPGRRVEGEAVTPGYFDLLGVKPFIGRLPAVDEYAQGERLLVLSHATWGREFGYDERIVGRPLRVSLQGSGRSETFTITGVLGPDFGGTTEDDMPDLEFWIPITSYQTERAMGERGARALLALGRLAPGATLEQARAQANALAAALAPETASIADDHAFRVEPFGADWREPFRDAGPVFGMAALILLAVAVINVSLLLVVRTLEVRHDYAIRIALGASRTRLASRVVARSLILICAGGAAGFTLAAPLLDTFLGLADVTLPSYLAPAPSPAILGFSFVALLLAGTAAAAAPAWLGANTPVMEVIREGEERTPGSARGRLWSGALIATEVALTVVLIAGAALLGRSYLNLGATDLGFATDQRLRTALFINASDVANDELTGFYEELEQELLAVPGVNSLALVWPTVPLLETNTARLVHPAVAEAAPNGLVVSAFIVNDSFFESLEMPLIAGRHFDARDSAGSALSIVISDSLARELGGVESVLGRSVEFSGGRFMVVGVVGDARFTGPVASVGPRDEVYLSLRQIPRRLVSSVVHVSGDPASFIPAVTGTMGRLAPDSAVDWVDALPPFIRWLYRDSAFRLALVATFGISALSLTLAGLYAVLSQQVVRARREIGIRKALGATDGSLLRAMIGRGLGVTAIGLAVGLVGALAAGRMLAGLLHGVSAYDPVALGAAGAAMLFAATLACWMPARRAAGLDPMQALREE